MSFYNLIAPGKYKATILDATEVSFHSSNERVTQVTWKVDGDTLVDKFKLDDNEPKKKDRAWRKMKKLAATLGLPQVIEGGRSYNELRLLPGKSCVIEVANFTADNDKTYHYVTDYLALAQKKPTVMPQLPQKPEDMGEIEDDAIPF